jgi:hypothetical protein
VSKRGEEPFHCIYLKAAQKQTYMRVRSECVCVEKGAREMVREKEDGSGGGGQD